MLSAIVHETGHLMVVLLMLHSELLLVLFLSLLRGFGGCGDTGTKVSYLLVRDLELCLARPQFCHLLFIFSLSRMRIEQVVLIYGRWVMRDRHVLKSSGQTSRLVRSFLQSIDGIFVDNSKLLEVLIHRCQTQGACARDMLSSLFLLVTFFVS